LVIIGANPGKGKDRDVYRVGATEYYRLAAQFAKSGKFEDYMKYRDYTAEYMNEWHGHFCNGENRRLLGYDIEEVAYLNLIKCRTEKPSSDVLANVGRKVVSTCYETHLRAQLELLRPKFIVGHWKKVVGTLAGLGYDISGCKCASASGARHLSAKQRISEIVSLFGIFANTKDK
jgi:hypothetical protein